jgi:hypothetical protein
MKKMGKMMLNEKIRNENMGKMMLNEKMDLRLGP